jgi:DNA-binding transcriptional LysR family regulator
MLDIRWLEDLLVLAETRNFRKAAAVRHVTQPGLSRRIQALERWASVPLIDRHAAPLALTEEGRALAAVAAEVVQRLRQQRLSFVDMKRSAGRHVVIAAPPVLTVAFLPLWLARIEQAVGDFNLTLLSGHLSACRAMLEEGKAHFLLCLLDRAGVMAGRTWRTPLRETGLAVVIGRDRLVPVSAPDAQGKPRHALGVGSGPVELLGYVRDCALSWAVDDLLARRPEITVRCRRESAHFDGLRGMALAGRGVAWVPESATQRERDAGLLVRAGDASLEIPCDIVAIRRADRLPPLAESVWRLLMEVQAEVPASVGPRLQAVVGS